MISYQGQYHTPSLSETMDAALMTSAHALSLKLCVQWLSLVSRLWDLFSPNKHGNGYLVIVMA